MTIADFFFLLSLSTFIFALLRYIYILRKSGISPITIPIQINVPQRPRRQESDTYRSAYIGHFMGRF